MTGPGVQGLAHGVFADATAEASSSQRENVIRTRNMRFMEWSPVEVDGSSAKLDPKSFLCWYGPALRGFDGKKLQEISAAAFTERGIPC